MTYTMTYAMTSTNAARYYDLYYMAYTMTYTMMLLQVFDRVLLDGPCSAMGQRPRLAQPSSITSMTALEERQVYVEETF